MRKTHEPGDKRNRRESGKVLWQHKEGLPVPVHQIFGQGQGTNGIPSKRHNLQPQRGSSYDKLRHPKSNIPVEQHVKPQDYNDNLKFIFQKRLELSLRTREYFEVNTKNYASTSSYINIFWCVSIFV